MKTTALTYRDFDLYKWQKFPKNIQFESEGIKKYFFELKAFTRTQEVIDAKACVLTFTMVYDSSYIVYGYKVEKNEYVFAWETGHDGIHRAYSQDSSKTFYDRLGQDTNFLIQVSAENPKLHYITEPDLAPMNKQVIYCDPKLS